MDAGRKQDEQSLALHGTPWQGARKTKERSRNQTKLSGNSTAKRNGFSGERGRQ